MSKEKVTRGYWGLKCGGRKREHIADLYICVGYIPSHWMTVKKINKLETYVCCTQITILPYRMDEKKRFYNSWRDLQGLTDGHWSISTRLSSKSTSKYDNRNLICSARAIKLKYVNLYVIVCFIFLPQKRNGQNIILVGKTRRVATTGAQRSTWENFSGHCSLRVDDTHAHTRHSLTTVWLSVRVSAFTRVETVPEAARVLRYTGRGRGK